MSIVLYLIIWWLGRSAAKNAGAPVEQSGMGAGVDAPAEAGGVRGVRHAGLGRS
jgi:hypothetical protein